MDENTIKEKIKIAHKSVSDEKEPYKLEAFKIILEKLLGDKSKTEDKDLGDQKNVSENEDKTGTISEPLSQLAEKCGIGSQELKNVVDYENNEFILLKKIEGKSDVQKKVVACQIIITAWIKGKNIEWVKGSTLRELVEKNSLGDTSSLAKNLNDSGFFRIKGKNRGVKYSLSTQGWQEGIKLITKFAEGN